MASLQQFRLDYVSPWNYGGETSHNWSVKFHTSGSPTWAAGEIEATALDFHDPIRRLTSSSTSLVAWSHYPAGSDVADLSKTYTPGAHPGDSTGYSAPDLLQQLEVCILAECPVGTSSKGRPVFLRKWIHDVQMSSSARNAHAALTSATVILQKWNTGCGPHSLVPVSPSTGVQGGPWVINTHLFTHQLRRGPKIKRIPPPNPI